MDMQNTVRMIPVIAVLMILLTVVGSETRDQSSGLTRLVLDYANEHIPRGDFVVGASDGGTVRWYTTGSLTPDTTFEIGSITKTVTGMLLAERIASGGITPTTTVRELWPDGTSAEASGIPPVPDRLAGITVTQLATHTSGLPRLNLGSWRFIRTFLHLDNPYARLTSTDVYRDAASARIDQPGEFRYSNLGFALLGRLLVEGTASDVGYSEQYLETIHNHVLIPLISSRFGSSDDSRFPKAYSTNGRRASSWNFDGYIAAGGLTASARDVLRYAEQLHHLPPEFRAAIQPQAHVTDTRTIGYGWFVDSLDNDETLIWHNGGTGGFSTFVGVVPERQLAVGVFSNSAVSVDELARAILLDHGSPHPPDAVSPFQWFIGSVLLVWITGFVLVRVWPLVKPRYRGATASDLLHVGKNAADAAFLVSIWARSTPAKLYIPGLEFLLLIAVGTATAVDIVRMKKTGAIPFISPTRTPWRVIAGGIQIVFFGSLAIHFW